MLQYFMPHKYKHILNRDCTPKLEYFCKVDEVSSVMPRAMHVHENLFEVLLVYEGSGIYTIDNKISRYDVGGLEYVYPDAVSSFQSVAENSIYKTVENNLDDTRTQDLPEVSEITLDSISETTFIMPDESEVAGYAVKLSWGYVEDLGYDTSATLILIPSDKKYGVVYFEPN